MPTSAYLLAPLTLLRHWRSRPVRYFAVAGFNTILSIVLYPALLWLFPALRTHYVAALVLAQSICTVVAFTIYKKRVFNTRGRLVREFSRFSAFYLANYAITWLCLPVLVERGGLSPMIAQWLFVVPLAVSSYLWHSRVSFRRSDTQDGCGA